MDECVAMPKKGPTSTKQTDQEKGQAEARLKWQKENESPYVIKNGKIFYKHADSSLVPIGTTCDSLSCIFTHM